MATFNRKFVLLRTLAVRLSVVVSILLVSTGPAAAKKPEIPGEQGKSKGASHHQENTVEHYFTSDRVSQIRSYYGERRVKGHCPPGLAKKNNGCQPPGQLQRWRKGEPLPRDLVYDDLPSALIDELGRTPEGQKLVRVGADILLISVGTGMVLDALEDLEDVF